MARPAKYDPVEVFRFEIKVISLSLNPTDVIKAIQNGEFSQFARAGFSTCTIPEMTTTVTEYRENVDNFGLKKVPGLTRFNDITLSRGVIVPPDNKLLHVDTDTSSNDEASANDFYKWVRQVSSFNPALSIASAVSGTTRNTILRQSNSFRKDLIIIQRDRNGRAARQWYILDAWPTSYKGGSDLDANSEAKSMESLTLTYEAAFEIPSATGALAEFIANVFPGPASDAAADTL